MTEIDQTLIIEEGLGALGVICHEVAELRTLCDFSKAPDGENSALIISNAKMGSLLETICHNQALAYSCLFDNGAKRFKESPTLFKLRVERVKGVRGLCGDISMTELSNKGVRNSRALRRVLLENDDRSFRRRIRKRYWIFSHSKT